MSEVQKDSEGISAGIDFLKIQYIRIFSGIWCQSWRGQFRLCIYFNYSFPMCSLPHKFPNIVFSAQILRKGMSFGQTNRVFAIFFLASTVQCLFFWASTVRFSHI
jgi:hypothetical protein